MGGWGPERSRCPPEACRYVENALAAECGSRGKKQVAAPPRNPVVTATRGKLGVTRRGQPRRGCAHFCSRDAVARPVQRGQQLLRPPSRRSALPSSDVGRLDQPAAHTPSVTRTVQESTRAPLLGVSSLPSHERGRHRQERAVPPLPFLPHGAPCPFFLLWPSLFLLLCADAFPLLLSRLSRPPPLPCCCCHGRPPV